MTTKICIGLMILGLLLITFEVSAEFAAGDDMEVKPTVKITLQTVGWSLMIIGTLLGK